MEVLSPQSFLTNDHHHSSMHMQPAQSPSLSDASSATPPPTSQSTANDRDAPDVKRFKSDPLDYHCIVCSDIYDDPNVLYEHMRSQHPHLYTDIANDQAATNETINDTDEREETDDFEYSSIMEPICELRHAEEELPPTTYSFRDQHQIQTLSLQQQLQQLQVLHQMQMQQEQLIALQKRHVQNGGTSFSQLQNCNVKTEENEEDNDDEEEDESRSTTSTSSNGLSSQVNVRSSRHRSDNKAVAPTLNADSVYQCSQCEQSFSSSGDLARHVRSHTLNKPFQCSICDKTFTHIGSLNTHIRIHSGEKPYKCKVCSKAFTQSSSLMVHMKSHSVRKPFQCNVCDKGFVNTSGLAIHMKIHAEVDPYPCDECDKTFKQANQLEDHRAVHQNLPMYQCSICRSRYQQACELVQHMKSHTGAKPFQCSICEKSFTQPGSLNTHMRIHTGERPFQCKLCPKSFSQASSLSMHKKTHVEPKSKAVECRICHKHYTNQTYLTKHMATCHESFACPICEQRFQEPISMFQHIARDHALGKERRLKCWECSQQFTSDTEFMVHLREHTDNAEQKLLQRVSQ